MRNAACAELRHIELLGYGSLLDKICGHSSNESGCRSEGKLHFERLSVSIYEMMEGKFVGIGYEVVLCDVSRNS